MISFRTLFSVGEVAGGSGVPSRLTHINADGASIRSFALLDRDCFPSLPELARWHHTVTKRLALTLVAPVPPKQAEALVREHAITDVLIDEQATVERMRNVSAIRESSPASAEAGSS